MVGVREVLDDGSIAFRRAEEGIKGTLARAVPAVGRCSADNLSRPGKAHSRVMRLRKD